jgi:hypothetical protein
MRSTPSQISLLCLVILGVSAPARAEVESFFFGAPSGGSSYQVEQSYDDEMESEPEMMPQYDEASIGGESDSVRESEDPFSSSVDAHFAVEEPPQVQVGPSLGSAGPQFDGLTASVPSSSPLEGEASSDTPASGPSASEGLVSSGQHIAGREVGTLYDDKGGRIGTVKQIRENTGNSAVVLDDKGKPVYYFVNDQQGDKRVMRRYKVTGPNFRSDNQYEGTDVEVEGSAASSRVFEHSSEDKTFHTERVILVPNR